MRYSLAALCCRRRFSLDWTWTCGEPVKPDSRAAHSPDRMPSPAKPRPRAALILALVLLPVLTGYLVWVFMSRSQPHAPMPESRLTSLPGAELHPSISPDGTRLAFTWKPEDSDNYDIYIMRLPGSRPERLTQAPTLDGYAEWSPDGTKLAYLRLPIGSDRYDLRVLETGLRQDRTVFSGRLPVIEPPAWAIAWSQDGAGLILPLPVDGGPRMGLARIDIATGVPAPLTRPEPPAIEDSLPALSPDGRSLLFVRRSPGGDGNVFRLNLNALGLPAGPPRQITDEPQCPGSPSWKRDGREIVFTSSRNGVPRLMRVSAQGGKAEAEPSVAAPAGSPRVAPNGWLVYTSAAMTGSILSVDLAGGTATGKPRPLIASGGQDGSPSWSPDGRLIAFSSARGGTRQIWVCARDGSAPRQFTKLDGAAPGISSWSPSGKWLAFEAQTAHGMSIYVANASTGAAAALPLDGKNNRAPCWSRGGQFLYYSSDETGRYEIWRAEIDADGAPLSADQVTRKGGFGAVESADGRFLYYSAGFSFSALHRVPARGGSEEEVLPVSPFDHSPPNFAAGARGIYFRGAGEIPGAPVWLLGYASRAPQRVLLETALPSPSGIALSPGGRQLLLPVSGYAAGDIFAVKTFR